ncbi:MAG: hypothetical protein R3255_07005 [Candidatus Lokiarchaeia archaeon]|nr:hypothetical protein [Candidatus Lokiarchaeia archaeon]
MDSQEFVKHLNEIQDLMEKENYTEALKLIDKLKKAEKKADFNYNLTHRLYQLDSNSRSLYNQQIILANVRDLFKKYKSITFQELNHVLRSKNKLNLTDEILRREIELLILRNQLAWNIEKDTIILNPN